MLLYISQCSVEVVIPLPLVISKCTLLILGEHKKSSFLKTLHGCNTNIPACAVDGAGTA